MSLCPSGLRVPMPSRWFLPMGRYVMVGHSEDPAALLHGAHGGPGLRVAAGHGGGDLHAGVSALGVAVLLGLASSAMQARGAASQPGPEASRL